MDEGPRDPSSVIQLLADTQRIKQLCGPEHSTALGTSDDAPPESELQSHSHVRRIRTGHGLLDDADLMLRSRTKSDHGRSKDSRVLDTICDVLRILFTTLPPILRNGPEHRDNLGDLDRLVQTGSMQIRAWPSVQERSNARLVTENSDVLGDPPRMRLLRRCLSFVARLIEGDTLTATPTNTAHSRLYDDDPYAEFASRLLDHISARHTTVLHIWLKAIFLSDWDGSPLLPQKSTAVACLHLMRGFRAIPIFDPECEAEGAVVDWFNPHAIEILSTQVDAVDMAKSWLYLLEHPGAGRSVHLLEFPWHFARPKLALYFRAINHLRMQQGHNDSEKAALLRGRTVPSSHDVDTDARLAFLEDHYLLLNIGRNNVLHDSFNQIWQRRSNELLRPLRVRLGEMDTFEVGHDLGGVQIEFFNLLCKDVFSKELGMFTSDPATGLSYFQAGCLQPLYMFELFGLLFALAVYNGVTLPVSFPIAFYMKLLGLPCEALQCIQDGWPEMHNALHATLREDVPGLDYAFALEANGVRLAISSYEEEPERETPKTTARVIEATAITHMSTSTAIDLHTLDWPGWSFEPASPDEPVEVNPENKGRYVDDYLSFLAHASVAAQWHHFLTGFHRILPSPHLSIFTPTHLRSLVEGTRALSIPDLRAITTYDGYMPNGPYMSAFWSLISSWPETKQKQLLKFVTAAERLPVGGAKDVVFRVHRVSHPGAEEALPTSSTCFGTLYLPKYASGEVLERKLTVALEMGGEGFGTG